MDELWAPRALGGIGFRTRVESYFLKLNSPDGYRAIWIKYTFLRPSDGGSPVGECWAIRFDCGPSGTGLAAVKDSYPLDACHFDAATGEIYVGHNRLTPTSALGQLRDATSFQVVFQDPPLPFRLLPDALYSDFIPATKLSTPVPASPIAGYFDSGGVRWSLDGWSGSLGHNWGRKHTSQYVWGQVAGTWQDRPLFFEGFSIPLSPSSGPSAFLSMGCLTIGEQRFAFNGPYSVIHNHASTQTGIDWSFEWTNLEYRLSGNLSFASREAVAALRYLQPSGRVLSCLNSMVANGWLLLVQRGGRGAGIEMEVHATGTAALEFLTSDLDHEIRVLA
jgi:hypothetical protein